MSRFKMRKEKQFWEVKKENQPRREPFLGGQRGTGV
jgi:hypothetical protein